MACLSYKFIHILLACLLLLVSGVRSDKTCEQLEESSKHMVYAASEQEDIKLLCDTAGTLANDDEAPFFWGRYHVDDNSYDQQGEVIFEKDRDQYDYTRIGNDGAELLIKKFNTQTDSTMWCCFVPIKRFISAPRANYAVLYIDNEDVDIQITPNQATFQLGDVITVTCSKTASMLDKIQPTIFWTSPNKPSFDFGAADAATSDSISLTVSKDMNGVQIQCGNRYERSNMGGKPLELKSRVATLDISFPTEMDDVSSTPNEDPITVELGKQTKLECAFVGNPPVEPSSKITWTRISALPKASTEETTAETLPQSSSDSCDASIPSATLLSPSAKVSMGAEVTDGVTYFSLTISDFSKADVGCYICALQPSGQKTLERAFNVVDSSSMKQTDSANTVQVSFVSLLTMLFLYPLLATIIFSPSCSV